MLGVDTPDVRSLAAAIAALTRLAELDLSGNGMGRDGAAALSLSLGQCTALRRLMLSRNLLGTDGVDTMVPALQALAGLQHPALQALAGLRHLDLQNNGIVDIIALAPLLSLSSLQLLR